jgi:GT2 family glycosyltransferase
MLKSTSRLSGRTASQLRSKFMQVADGGFAGYVFDEADTDLRFAVEILLDGFAVRLLRADAYTDELASNGIGDGCYAFSFVLPDALVATAAVIEARLANSTTLLGPAIPLQMGTEQETDFRGLGGASWMGGLRFQGWIRDNSGTPPTITARIDGVEVARARATLWKHVGGFDNADIVRAFDLYLPNSFADGQPRRVSFTTEDRRSVSLSPVAFVAFADGVADFFDRSVGLKTERFRGRLLERLMPMSAPFSDYDYWDRHFPAAQPKAPARTLAIVLLGSEDSGLSLKSLKRQPRMEWIAATFPEANEAGSFAPADIKNFILGDAAQCAYVVFACAGIQFSPGALLRLMTALEAAPKAALAYGDVDYGAPDSADWPLALPAFDYERMLEQGYFANLFAMPRLNALQALEGRSTSLYRIANSVFDGSGYERLPGRVIHVPRSAGRLPPLDVRICTQALASATAAHLQVRGVPAKVHPSRGSILPAVRVARDVRRPSTTIVIPVRNRAALLRTCLESIEPTVSATGARIMIVDNGSAETDMLEYLAQLGKSRIRILSVPGSFNFARLNNIAAEAADTELLCLLNNDIKAVDHTWLSELQSRIAEPDVGAVGAMLSWPSGVVQHGGVVLGASFAAVHAFNDRLDDDPGYCDMLRVAHECSAVTAACLLTRRADYLNVGGMDEVLFPVNFNDVDYCLKLRNIGKRIVFTPHARLDHLESASRGGDKSPDKAARFDRELRNLRARWGDYLVKDSYYNPVLSLDPIPFSALAWPPRDCSPRRNELPEPVSIPPGF